MGVGSLAGALLVPSILFQIVHIPTEEQKCRRGGSRLHADQIVDYSAALALWLVLMLVCFSESLSLFTFASAWRTPAP